jgi:hypothetical protein
MKKMKDGIIRFEMKKMKDGIIRFEMKIIECCDHWFIAEDPGAR